MAETSGEQTPIQESVGHLARGSGGGDQSTAFNYVAPVSHVGDGTSDTHPLITGLNVFKLPNRPGMSSTVKRTVDSTILHPQILSYL